MNRLSVGAAFAALLLPMSLLSPAASAFSGYVSDVPNGSVTGCNTCHTAGGGTARNAFGLDVAANLTPLQNVDWAALYDLDSDGDGQTNGEELGDPCGAWTGGPAPRTTDISQPGNINSTSADPNTPVCDPCMGLTLQGECAGTTVRYCANDTIVEYDCATQFPNTPATCGEISAEWGFDCMIGVGGSCRWVNQQQEPVTTFCETGDGCFDDLDAQTATCVDNVGTCNPDAFTRACDGDRLMMGCLQGQPEGLFCPGTSTCSDGACRIAEGDACDNDGLVCADGLLCQAGTCVVDQGLGPCNGITLQGECEGNTVRFCANDEVIEYDCSVRFPDTNATCGEVSAEYGFDCIFAEGDSCSWANGEGQTLATFCPPGDGCLLDGAENAVCVDAIGTCTADDVASGPTCIGNNVMLRCDENTPHGIQCPQGSVCSDATCGAIPAGGYCDDSGFYACGPNLTCTDNACIDPNNPPPVDGGTPGDDAGTPGNDDGGTPGNDDGGTPGNDDGGTPGNDDAGTPGNDDAGTPGNDDGGTPGNDDAGTPGNDDAGTPDDDAGAPEPDASPEGEPAASPEGEPSASPEGEPAASPEGEPSASPEGEPSASPEGEPAASPEGEPSSSPEGEPDDSVDDDGCESSAVPSRSAPWLSLSLLALLGLVRRRRR